MLLKQQRERPFRPERGFEHGPLRCRCGARPVELSCQLAAGRCVGRCLEVKPNKAVKKESNVEIDDGNTGIFHVFEMLIAIMNKFYHRF